MSRTFVSKMSILFAFSLCAYAEKFSLSCGTPPPPLRPILNALDQTELAAIDKSCAADGGSDQTPKQLESAAKNNFCASDAPVSITTQTLVSLQREINKDSSIKQNLKANRDALKNLVKVGAGRVGEGTGVQLVAYLLEAHFPKSNVKK